MDMWEQYHRNREAVTNYYKELNISYPMQGEFVEVYSEHFLIEERCKIRPNAKACKLVRLDGSYFNAYHPSQVYGKIHWYRYKRDEDDFN